MSKKTLVADFCLLLVTILWGYTYIASKWVLWEVGEFYFLSLRFLLSASVLLLFLLHKLDQFNKTVIKEGLVCGLVLASAFYFQTLGLEFSSPGTAGMITGLFVVIVPFLYFFFSKKPLQLASVMGSLIAFIGLFIFSYDEKAIQHDSLGELYLFLCAIAYATHIVFLDRTYKRRPNIDPQIFAFIQILLVGVVFVPFALCKEQFPWPISNRALYGLLYDILFGTIIAYSAQIFLQKYSPPTHVSLIFATEAVFAFLFSWWLYGEIITPRVLTGAFLMMSGILITEILEQHKFKLRGKIKLWQYQRKH
jgi:drug/metabolite transporter (DMT)-like permease